MELIKLINEGAFIGITMPDGEHLSIRASLLKRIEYRADSGDIILEKVKGNTIPLNYLKVEDPNNLGNPFLSLDAMWTWTMDAIGGDTINFIFTNGDNFVFMDGNNFIFN